MRIGESRCRIIHARDRFITPRATTTTAVTAVVIRPDFNAAHRKPEKPCTFAPSIKTLPFVKMKGGGRRATAASYWKDVPTGDGRDDFKRGRKYAALTIAAIIADGCASWDLEKIIKAVVIDAASRKAKGGKFSPCVLPPAIEGFIHELSHQLCVRITGSKS
jgi:hypothetical protein